jgi:hypothetical protein
MKYRLSLLVVCMVLLLVSAAFQNAKAELKGAVGIWLFDEGKGDVATDSSGNKNHGKIEGGSKWVDGKFGKALEFNGTNGAVQVPDSPSLDLVEAVSMVSWFWWAGAGDGWQTFFSKGPIAAPGENYAHFTNSPGQHLHFVLTPGGARQFLNGGKFEPKKWHHTAAVWDGKKAQVYLDGKLVGEQAMAGKLAANNFTLRIGHREASSHWWMGVEDEMAVFNRALSEKEVLDIMNNGLAKSLGIEAKGKLTTSWGEMKGRAR